LVDARTLPRYTTRSGNVLAATFGDRIRVFVVIEKHFSSESFAGFPFARFAPGRGLIEIPGEAATTRPAVNAARVLKNWTTAGLAKRPVVGVGVNSRSGHGVAATVAAAITAS
jgi:hypothetical protein